MDNQAADRYLTRIGAGRPTAPDLDALAELMARHLRTVPFENLSIHLDEPIRLRPEALLDKIVERRRGGFCYELNGAFGLLLEQLGYNVTLLAARVHSPDGLGPPFDHLALRVDLDEAWLVDVGFGRFTQRPVRLAERSEQADPEGVVVVTDVSDGDVDLTVGGQLQYRLEFRARRLPDFVPTCWWHQTSPASHFTQSLTCSLPTPEGRVTLSDRELITTVDGQRSVRRLGSDREVLDTYHEAFGIELDHLPKSPQATRADA